VKFIHDFVFGFVDYPNRLAATLFFNGCNLSCPYCYNQRVVGGRPVYDLEDVSAALKKTDAAMMGNRVAVVFSGGEPTANLVGFQAATDHFMAEGRSMALHTNGLNGFRDVFNSVVLSVKTTNDGIRNLDRYRQRLLDIMLFGCKNATYKELRVVDHMGARAERFGTLDLLKDKFAIDGWRLNVIKPIEGAK